MSLSAPWLRALRAPADLALSTLELRRIPDDVIAAAGLVSKPDTLNYRTLLPEKGGLFCTEIFGEGDVAPAADTPPTHPRLTRTGRIELAVPLPHPLLLAHAPDELAVLGDDGLVRRLPVVPPYLRPMKQLAGGRWATSDVNDLYRRVINRNNRLARLVELGAPEVILTNETRMLQEALLSLFENEDTPTPVTGPDDRVLVSLRGLAGGAELFDYLRELDAGAPTAPPSRRFVQRSMLEAMGLEAHRREPPAQLGVPL